MTREQEEALVRAGLVNLRKALAGRPFSGVVWRPKDGRKNRDVRLTRRVGGLVYFRWSALGSYPPRGMSQSLPLGKFLMEYEPKKRDW